MRQTAQPATRPAAKSRARTGAAGGPRASAWALVRLTRPWFWPLGWGGAYLGAVLASRSWVPLTAEPLDALAVAVVLGPLVWGAVLALNDRHDLPSDRLNPRKARAPLVTGVLTTEELRIWSAMWTVAAVLVALTVGPAARLPSRMDPEAWARSVGATGNPSPPIDQWSPNSPCRKDHTAAA